MCNRYRMTAKRAEVALPFGVDPALIMPEPERQPPPERLAYVVARKMAIGCST